MLVTHVPTLSNLNHMTEEVTASVSGEQALSQSAIRFRLDVGALSVAHWVCLVFLFVPLV